jgi:hypothetical protein
VSFDVKSSKGRVSTGTKKMALGVSLAVPKLVTKMASVCAVVSSCCDIGSVDGLGASSGPEGAKAQFVNVPEGRVWAAGSVAKVVAWNWDSPGCERLKATVSFGLVWICGQEAICKRW